ncbi:MAG: RcnB family protein, partial [Acetobacter cibinongensis]
PAPRQNFDQRRGGPGPQARNRGGWNGGERRRDWHRGERYDGGGYYVDNWRGYNGLYAPPNGYRWINYGGTFLLTAIATGVISNIIANQAQGYSGY